MSLKKGGSPKTLQVSLTIVGQGTSDKLQLTYHNRKSSEVDAFLEKEGTLVADVIPYIVESWDTDFPLTQEGVLEAEDEYPGFVNAVLEGFRKARRKEAEKN